MGGLEKGEGGLRTTLSHPLNWVLGSRGAASTELTRQTKVLVARLGFCVYLKSRGLLDSDIFFLTFPKEGQIHFISFIY